MKEDVKHIRLACVIHNRCYWQKHMLVLICALFLLLLQCLFCRCTMKNNGSTCSILATNGGRSIDMGKYRQLAFNNIYSINYLQYAPCIYQFCRECNVLFTEKKYPPGMVKDLKKTEDVAEVRYCIVDGYCLLLQLLLLLQFAVAISCCNYYCCYYLLQLLFAVAIISCS